MGECTRESPFAMDTLVWNGNLDMKNRLIHIFGFSLIEVMFGVLIFTTSILGSFSMVNIGWGIIDNTQDWIYVNHILESRLEEVRDLTFDELDALPNKIHFSALPATTVFGKEVNPYVVDDAYQRELGEATGTVHIEQIDTDLKKVTIVVAWRTGNSDQSWRNMNISTLIARNGVNRQ